VVAVLVKERMKPQWICRNRQAGLASFGLICPRRWYSHPQQAPNTFVVLIPSLTFDKKFKIVLKQLEIQISLFYCYTH